MDHLRHLFAYDFAMGGGRRAMDRSDSMVDRFSGSKSVIVTWKANDHDLLVNFLDPRSRLPITRQRVFHDKATVLGLIQRSLSDFGRGPRYILLMKDLERGNGEVEIIVSAEQYAKLAPKKSEAR